MSIVFDFASIARAMNLKLDVSVLSDAVREFESTFANVRKSDTAWFDHEGRRYEHTEVFSGCLGSGIVCREKYMHDSASEAIAAWRKTIKPFEGASYLYWRVKPELDQDDGKWGVYSRFCVIP